MRNAMHTYGIIRENDMLSIWRTNLKIPKKYSDAEAQFIVDIFHKGLEQGKKSGEAEGMYKIREGLKKLLELEKYSNE